MFPSVSLVLLTSLSILLRTASAQVSTNAECEADWDILNNAEGQSPCLVAAYLLSVCAGGEWILPAIPDGDRFYDVPNADYLVGVCDNRTTFSATVTNTISDCSCSSVTYNMLQACAFCQPVGFVRAWDDYRVNCGGIFSNISVYPFDIPLNTSVPSWAYIDPDTTGGAFNQTVAQQFISLHVPDHTATPVSTEAASPTVSTPAATNVPTTTLLPSNDGSPNSTPSSSSRLRIPPSVHVHVIRVAFAYILYIVLCW